MPIHQRPVLCAVLAVLVMGGCKCGTGPRVQRIAEDYKVVPGQPGVNPDQPEVDSVSQPPPVSYVVNVPRQCDIFTQNTVRKVDILWVIQNSGSMGPHQQQLAQNIQGFIQYLLSADPPIDFHIGVTSTDTDGTAAPAQGQLNPWSQGGNTGNFISCDSSHVCNTLTGGGDPTASVEAAFSQMSDVGTLGSSRQRGLYASYLALNRPENIDNGSGTGFIRSDAALYVVYVASEDDLSCSPTVNHPAPGDTCNSVDAECKCKDNSDLDWGSTDFYTRFLQNYKGYGHSDLVAAAAVVAVDQDAIPPENGAPYNGVGCSGNDPSTGQAFQAYYGKRYIDVVQATGGAATSICASNFSDALSRLGFAVSGLRRDFKLTRGPSPTSLTAYEARYNSPTCSTDAECATEQDGYNTCAAGHCSKGVPVSLQPRDDGAQYIQCDDSVLRNIVEFAPNSDVIPPAQGTVEICYDVDAHFNPTCQ